MNNAVQFCFVIFRRIIKSKKQRISSNRGGGGDFESAYLEARKELVNIYNDDTYSLISRKALLTYLILFEKYSKHIENAILMNDRLN